MFSLDWVKNKARVMGSAHLINDYVEHGDILDKEVLSCLTLQHLYFTGIRVYTWALC